MSEEKSAQAPFEYLPVDRVCPVCGAKHFERGPLCYLCNRSGE